MGRGSARRARESTGIEDRMSTRSTRSKGLDLDSRVPASPQSSRKRKPPASSSSGRPRSRHHVQDSILPVDLGTPDTAGTPDGGLERGVSNSVSTDVAPEIVVNTDDLEMMDLQESDAMPTPQDSLSMSSIHADPQCLSKQLLAMSEKDNNTRPSFTSSMSALSDQSDLSSILSSLSSKATTPVDLDGPKDILPPPPSSVVVLQEEPSQEEQGLDKDKEEQSEGVKEEQSGETQVVVCREPEENRSGEAQTEICPQPQEEQREEEAPRQTPKEQLCEISTTPAIPQPKPSLPPPPRPRFRVRDGPNRRYDVRPKNSIPTDLSPQEYAVQCIGSAESSRFNPYALHQEEYLMLRDHISLAQITTYLNIRNGILRLWVRNPTISITREEAIGCAKDSRWFDVANLCFDWLVRTGYINFGCCEIRQSRKQQAIKEEDTAGLKRKTVVVIGAGVAGLGCARQLQGLFMQYAKRFRERGEQPPKVVVLEGRNRVGGRVYSRPFRTRPAVEPAALRGKRYTAEMGGMIVTGFERGNPINILIRGQLGLAYHALRSDATLITIYDSDGKPVDTARDQLVEKLYNDCLDRVSEYKWKLPLPKLLQGNRDLIDDGKDSFAELHKTISYVEETTAAQPHAPPVSEQNIAPRVDMVPVSSDRVTGRIHVEPGVPGATKASHKAKLMGWSLQEGIDEDTDIDLDPATKAPGATLGSVLDDAILQYNGLVDICPQDMRLINWHIANLEYSNARNLNQLSLEGWDMDVGNEWEGRHSMIVGGYQSLATGLAQFPSPLDIQYKKAVRSIAALPPRPSSADGGKPRTEVGDLYKIGCEDGSVIEADYVVNSIPLGVLKHGDVEFDPPLPQWKTEAIDRLGFGVLNKVVLVYDRAFWEEDKDIFGVLRQPQSGTSLDPRDYSSRRGRFFQWFNVTHTSGMPTLLALMAGDAAFDTEKAPDGELVAEATDVLRSIFGQSAVPEPTESIVTRWGSDRFARGSYSSAGPAMRLDDYDLTSRPVGDGHFFAGEHTSATHPATVHGAYISGLRAASDVVNAMLGPIEVQRPLIVPKESAASALKRKAAEAARDPRTEALEAYEARLWEHMRARLGDYPLEPPKMTAKAHILFIKAHFEAARQRCLDGRRPGKTPPSASEVRSAAAKMWNAAGEEERRPFVEQVTLLKERHAAAVREFATKAEEYGRRAAEVTAEYEKKNPRPVFPEDPALVPATGPGATPTASSSASPAATEGRRAKRTSVGRYTEPDDDVAMAG
ncbi:hypothetical protein RB597_000612 [Gaeumannomyces tritici]